VGYWVMTKVTGFLFSEISKFMLMKGGKQWKRKQDG